MQKPDFNDLIAFRAVAREGSFTRAAAQLGLSPSALSHTIRRLETVLDVRLLARTTRSVALTDAGERLLHEIGHHLDDIDRAVETLMATRDRPTGTLRINAGEHAVRSVLWPKLDRFLRHYPDIKVEVDIDNGYTDIVAGRYDAGVRLGQEVAADMIAVRIGPDWRMAVVAVPDYFREHGVPRSPHDLTRHRCINLRLATYGGFYAWEFERDGEPLKVRVDGQLAFNSSLPILTAALAGQGLAFIPEDMAATHIAEGRLQRVLTPWCAPFTGYHLYYPSRRQSSPAFQLLLDALRFKP
ncbi:LysR family transcriptional regulator [Phyllobacterium sp. SYP-B3895]|uniref:LysR family transcriptional regulator n=1 Tax=Phyllobacterium sp. SYP-B3895 TaxID=2663240 RepID=UPI00129968EC|nr:LysR family transcriptional regulator [Phyllobacterium sp. SYP-B3895]MRG55120.1 LysR family transcriptional regulator [Phyllobacterium sp. SYP-B3895]